jgi:3-isopropylmalate dehydratase small subunit
MITEREEIVQTFLWALHCNIDYKYKTAIVAQSKAEPILLVGLAYGMGTERMKASLAMMSMDFSAVEARTMVHMHRKSEVGTRMHKIILATGCVDITLPIMTTTPKWNADINKNRSGRKGKSKWPIRTKNGR